MGANTVKGTVKHMVRNGEVWTDQDGHPIYAHSGGLLRVGDTYFWYGENKDGPTLQARWNRVDFVGVACYSSRDLLSWTPHGLVLAAEAADPAHDLHPSKVVERPKVLHCPRTGQYVMWLHIDHADYTFARCGVAVSETPTGPFRYLGSFAPCGLDSRDFTVFQDDDGAAYLFFSSGWNSTLRVARLEDDYLRPASPATDVFVERFREAPAVFRVGQTCHLVTSGCTGWDPNEAEHAVAPHPLGPWRTVGNPCTGPDADTTFHAQPTFALPLGMGAVLVMLDRWNKDDLRDSRYVWLLADAQGETLNLCWQDRWNGLGGLPGGGGPERSDPALEHPRSVV